MWNTIQVENLPEPVNVHCIVKINSSTILSIGGHGEHDNGELDYVKKTYLFNSQLNTWTPGPSLLRPRALLSCGILRWKNPKSNEVERIVVAAGGFDNPRVLSSVELLYLDRNESSSKSEWQKGPELPKAVKESTMIEYDNSVILIGGKGEVDGFHLYQLFSPNGSWLEMKQTLKTNRSLHVAFLVPDELVNCH